jgi:hypothetical protein
MNPVAYTLFVQRTQAIMCGLSFLFISAILALMDPFTASYPLFLLLVSLFILLWNGSSLVSFWWYISLQKTVLTTRQTNMIIIRALVYGVALINLIVFNLVGELTIIPVLATLICILLAHLWLPV